MRNDEAPEIFGHMQGLSIVDANLHIKGANLDGQIGFVDFSLMTAVTDASGEKSDFLGKVQVWFKFTKVTNV